MATKKELRAEVARLTRENRRYAETEVQTLRENQRLARLLNDIVTKAAEALDSPESGIELTGGA